jgi:hypothetical protein
MTDTEPNDQDGRHSHEAEIDEALEETFPSSDPPSTWAGADGEE